MQRELGNELQAAEWMSGLGVIEHMLREPDIAAGRFREALTYFMKVNNLVSAISPLRGLALLAATSGRHDRAAILLGAEDRILENTGGGPPALMDRIADVAGIVKEALGEARSEDIRLGGKAMETDAAILYALGDES
ncbi:MAG: hypothetical protein H0U86_04430 [Chloroflexi bacterium]|nr:hypothetical protein [Chloroflexota bacterium]